MTEILTSYIYLLHEREFINSKERIYKVGKTRQINFERFKQYPKCSMILLYSICNDCDICESKILSVFRRRFIKRTDIGSEYFEGDHKEMMFEINRLIYCLEKKEMTDKVVDITTTITVKSKVDIKEKEKVVEKEIEKEVEKEVEEESEFEEEYFIEKIVSHRGNIANFKKMKFEIKWKGYDESENTFETYDNLKETEALDKYLWH